MNGEAVRELADRFREAKILYSSADKELIAIPQGWSVKDAAAIVEAGPTAESLKVYSLGAVRDYLQANRDTLSLSTLVVHVVSPQIVRLVGPIQERARNREVYLEATAQNLTDGFLGKAMSVEDFIVGLQTRFVENDARAALMRLFGTVKHEGVKTSSDDGVTQTVTAKAGVVLANEVPVPNPVQLVPYRTFREVDQPASPFVLRVSGATTGTVTAALHEGDGGAWRLTAVEGIARWLRVSLPDTVAVLA